MGEPLPADFREQLRDESRRLLVEQLRLACGSMLTNVARHAGVAAARVRVSAAHGLLSVVVTDRGNGFDADAVPASGATGGLAGMRERAALLGGTLLVESAPGTGTQLRGELPVSAEAYQYA